MSSLQREKIATLISYDEIESEAIDQLARASNRDFITKMAVMPDIHAGYDLPIGAVALCKDVISPSFVGYDIGCGMCQVKLPEPADDILRQISAPEIHRRIHQLIPVGFDTRSRPLKYPDFFSASGSKNLDNKVGAKLGIQLGTLGGGNHFIEFGKNAVGEAFLTIHSGSRNPGHSVADHHMKVGKYLPLHSEEGRAYLADMDFMLQFALDNRLNMMRIIVEEALGYSVRDWESNIETTLINENHNHAVITPEGVLHRKGATPAKLGQMGVIPGNMHDGVYITRGLGNAEYLESASHGAGRTMSRKKARSTINLENFRKSMEGIASDAGRRTLDEAPEAYKKLDDVIAAQRGVVVEIVDYVRPVVNVKG